MQRISRISSLVAVALLAACATARPRFPCPAQGGPTWREFRTEHIVLDTDLDGEAARSLASELDWSHQFAQAALGAILGHPVPPSPPLRVVAFASEAQFRRLVGPRRRATYSFSQRRPVPSMVLQAGDASQDVLVHEMTHHAMHHAIGLTPQWLTEGMPMYVEHRGRFFGTGLHRPPDPAVLRRLLSQRVGGLEADAVLEYIQSTMLVHFLIAKYPRELREYLGLLQERVAPSGAWKTAFPQWNPERDGDLAKLVALLHLPLPDAWPEFAHPVMTSVPISERELGSGEVHGLWVTMPRVELEPTYDEGVVMSFFAEIDEGLREDPGNLDLSEVDVLVRRDHAARDARAAIAAHPESARAWLLQSGSLPERDRAGRETALRKAVEAEPENARALDALASLLVEDGRAGEAVPLARKAVANAPYVLMFEDTLAAALDGTGDCAAALVAARHLRELLWWENPKGQEKALRRYQDLERRCGTPSN